MPRTLVRLLVVIIATVQISAEWHPIADDGQQHHRSTLNLLQVSASLEISGYDTPAMLVEAAAQARRHQEWHHKQQQQKHDWRLNHTDLEISGYDTAVMSVEAAVQARRHQEWQHKQQQKHDRRLNHTDSARVEDQPASAAVYYTNRTHDVVFFHDLMPQRIQSAISYCTGMELSARVNWLRSCEAITNSGPSGAIIMIGIILVVFIIGFCILTEVDEFVGTFGPESRGKTRATRQPVREDVDAARQTSDREVDFAAGRSPARQNPELSRGTISRFLGSGHASPPMTPPETAFHKQLEQALNYESVESAEQLLATNNNSGRATPSRGPYVPADRSSLPAAICDFLVLQHSEAWFAVSFADLEAANTSGSFDLLGHTGQPLFRVNVAHTGNGGRLGISLKPPMSPTLASVQCGSDGVMHIFGGNGATYGQLISAGHMSFTIVGTGGRPIISMSFNQMSEGMHLVSPEGNTEFACAARCLDSAFFTNNEHLEIRVSPGMDAVLALLCILGVVVFGSHGGHDIPMSDAIPGQVH